MVLGAVVIIHPVVLVGAATAAGEFFFFERELLRVYIVWNQPRGSQKVVSWILKRCSIFLARDCFLGGLDGLSCSCLVCRTEARPRRGKCATVFHARVKKV